MTHDYRVHGCLDCTIRATRPDERAKSTKSYFLYDLDYGAFNFSPRPWLLFIIKHEVKVRFTIYLDEWRAYSNLSDHMDIYMKL